MAIATRRVLVIKTSSLGDIMHGLQVAQTLKENDPGIEITWIARSRFEPLVRASSAVDHVIAYHRLGGISALVSLCQRLRRKEFDVVLDFQGLARSGVMTFFSKAPRKIGRSDAREGATLFYQELVPMPKSKDPLHPVDILLEFCRVFGFETELKGTVQFVVPESSKLATRSEEGRKRVVISPEGRSPSATWSRFDSLADQMLERDGFDILVIGTRSFDWVNQLQKSYKDRVKRVVTGDPLKLASLLQDSDLLVANDSDATHVAAAVGTPTVALFGPTDGDRLGPYPQSEPRNCALNAPKGDLSALSVERALEEVFRRI